MTKTIIGMMAVCTVFLTACEDSLDTDTYSAIDQASYNDYIDARNDAGSVDARVFGIDELTEAPEDATAELNGVYSIETTYTIDEPFPVEDVIVGYAGLVGEMTMNVDFGDESVSGSFHNSYYDADGDGESSVIELDGSVEFSGSIDMDSSGGFYDSTNTVTWQIEADAAGSFDDVFEDDGTATTYRLDVDINGDFFDASGVGTVGGVGDIGDIASEGMIEGNIDITTAEDTILYDVTDGTYFVYELED